MKEVFDIQISQVNKSNKIKLENDFTVMKKILYKEYCETMEQFYIKPKNYREWLKSVTEVKLNN